MTIPPRSAPLIETFNTHLMADATVTALATAREQETAEILDAIHRNLTVVPGPLQHVVVYAPRGFGKSFMTRLIQIETAKIAPAEGRIIYVLLPEEQHNLTRSPHALLTYLTAKLADQRLGQNRSWTEAAFRWPRPDQEAALWDGAVRDLEAELDASLDGQRGLVIAAIENFDTLLATLFKADPDEQRLRKWLGRAGNRLMLLATGTRTADIDYERPLFQAFQSVRLEPWSSDDCVAYFNRRRTLEGKPALDGRTEAKARAIADFIGGNPRLAQLLGDVLETGDAMTVAGTMTALADRLADYYRRRIDDLPQLAQGLVDALIRGGEPCSATELATRVGAQQSDIARVMQDLRQADVIRGTPASDSRETMFRIVDRVFVHFYRLRQGNELVRTSPLQTILEFLRTFYSREEQREQAARYLEQGQPAEAMVFSRLVLEEERPGTVSAYRRDFPSRLRLYLAAAPEAVPLSADEIVSLLDGTQPADLEAICNESSASTMLEATIRGIIRAQVRCRLSLLEPAEHLLRTLLNEAGEDPAAITVAAEELGEFLGWEHQALQDSRLAFEKCAAQCEALASPHLAIMAYLARAWCLSNNKQTAEQAIVSADQAAAIAGESKELRAQAMAIQYKSIALARLGRQEEAIVAADYAAAFAGQAADVGVQATAFLHKALVLDELGRHEEAIVAAEQAAAFAGQSADIGEQATAILHKIINLNRLKRYTDAIVAADHAASLARQAADSFKQALAILHKAFALCKLGRHEEAIGAGDEAAKLAMDSGEIDSDVRWVAAMALNHGSDSQRALGRLDDAWRAALAASNHARAAQNLWAMRMTQRAIIATAALSPRPGVVPAYREWIDIQDAGPEAGGPAPSLWLDTFLTAVMRAGAWSDFDQFASEQANWLGQHRNGLLSSEIGQAIAGIFRDSGRAAGFEAARAVLPRLGRLLNAGNRGNQEPIAWLQPILGAFAEHCRDPGMLRDVAGLLDDALAPDAAQVRALLQALADFDAGRGGEAGLTRIDPDVATWIRRIRNIPEEKPPAPAPAKPRGKRRG